MLSENEIREIREVVRILESIRPKYRDPTGLFETHAVAVTSGCVETLKKLIPQNAESLESVAESVCGSMILTRDGPFGLDLQERLAAALERRRSSREKTA